MSEHVEALIERAKSGELSAASELLSRHYARIFAYFRRLCGSDEDAADLTQKAFCKVWASLARFHGRSSFNTWLHSIAHNTYVDWRRQGNRLDAQTDDWWKSCATNEPGPLENITGQEDARRLYGLVEQLDEEQRETIHLHYYQELTILETADALGVATSTVKYRVRQAIELLKSRMAEPKLRA